MKYVGMHSLIQRNNRLSVLLLLGFPAILLGAVWLFMAAINYFGNSSGYDEYGYSQNFLDADAVNYSFMKVLPWVVGAVAIWFAIAYFSNTSMIRHAVKAQPLMRRDNPRVYNIVENLTMACGMPMPQVNIVDDPQLNAFASGIDEKTYTVTVTTGLLDRLNDDELAGVIGHELTHIRNRDTRLLITSIIFVGIISTIMTVVVRMLWNNFIWGGSRRSNNEKGNGLSVAAVMLIGVVCAAIAYFFTLLTRFAISRKREFMADAGGAELCGNPLALASALRKISGAPGLQGVGRDDIAQMYIVHPQALSGDSISGFFSRMFSTHPSTEERIRLLEQY
ncbi:MAG: M48 family metallopeptidase [Prevotella sp.]|nr:M48 family metallopeptidase [Prevotella sp.]MBR6998255.1 M48 family metallopeptidase [Prevotella sp.]